MNSDFKDLLNIFADEQVEFLVVGGYAVIFHTQPRYTKDLDIWVKPSAENAKRISRAFRRFGVPMVEVDESDFANPGLHYAIGMPPSQIDFLTSLPGVEFADAWQLRHESRIENFVVPFLGIQHLIAAKRSAGRPQDLADLGELERASDAQKNGDST